MTTRRRTPGGKDEVVLHEKHAARLAPRRPFVFVYDVPEHTSLILQYRAQAYMCTHRVFTATNKTTFPTVRATRTRTLTPKPRARRSGAIQHP